MLDKSHKLVVEAAKGDKARAKLEDETFKEALSQLKADYIAAWEGTGVNDATAREKIYMAVKALDGFEQQEKDPESDLDYVPNTARQAKVDVILSNSLGVGGHNVTICLRRFAG